MKPALALLPLIFASVFAFAKSGKKIYYGIANETTFPFVEVDSSKGQPEVVGGILKNLAETLAGELGLTPVLVLLPQKRVGLELESGNISMVCFVHESWFPREFTRKLLWTTDLTTNTNYVATYGKKAVKSIEDLKGKEVGTIVNYFYKKLDPYFEKGIVFRETGPNTDSNVEKLVHGRIDYILISNLEFDYYKKKYPQLQAHDLKMDTLKVKCAVSKKADINISELNQAIESLKKSGKMEKIFRP